jgi:hypothetical protein
MKRIVSLIIVTGLAGCGTSKEIVIEKIDEKWVVVNDDGMWSVK